MNAWLVDTGPLVAYLDAGDQAHTKVTPLWDGFEGRLFITSAVITEVMHFVSVAPDGATSLAELVAASRMEVFDLTQAPELREAALLMKRYADTPMDFADATLVLLAEAVGVYDILTLDRRGFAVYRTRNGRTFRNVLDISG
ncbi:MAG TPA: PIN domain-containing protein [Balneolales bacterium]|nr:PIN domain-containing protein [Balneolales bacterium]